MMKELYQRLQEKTGKYFRPILLLALLWAFTLLLFIGSDAEKGVLMLWGGALPYGIVFYYWSFSRSLPAAFQKKYRFWSYFKRSVLFLAITWVPVALIAVLIMDHEDTAFEFSFFNILLNFTITFPLSWFMYKRHLSGREEVLGLRKELGRSAAEFDFLRSQINPHFLFNALNTIYGLALEEGAERTSESVEKLGDMMRFMLQENMQERIPLSRELDYMNNYIYLQRLRTASIPGLSIDTFITESRDHLEIAPMLLIPFVENAFKHGISMREPSQIRMTLEVKERTVYFDVHNSKHPVSAYDPEKHNSGIGLANVKQRLQLLYPKKHELVIRDTAKDFFVHLTIRL